MPVTWAIRMRLHNLQTRFGVLADRSQRSQPCIAGLGPSAHRLPGPFRADRQPGFQPPRLSGWESSPYSSRSQPFPRHKFQKTAFCRSARRRALDNRRTALAAEAGTTHHLNEVAADPQVLHRPSRVDSLALPRPLDCTATRAPGGTNTYMRTILMARKSKTAAQQGGRKKGGSAPVPDPCVRTPANFSAETGLCVSRARAVAVQAKCEPQSTPQPRRTRR